MFKRMRSDEDFAAENRAHLELEADALKDVGVGDGEARRHSAMFTGRATELEIVGVVKDVREGPLDAAIAPERGSNDVQTQAQQRRFCRRDSGAPGA
ncbi:MAG: hypothetical protein WCC26_05560 [Terracidiphilus sp.]